MRKLFKFVSKKILDLQKQKEEYEKNVNNEKKIRQVIINKHSEKKPEQLEIVISTNTVVKILFIFIVFMIGIRVVEQLQTLLIMTSISGLLALGLTPILNQIESKRIPRPLAICILYIIFLGAISVLFIQIVPIIAEQLLGIAHDVKNFVLSDDLQLPFLDKLNIDINIDIEGIKNLIASNLADISKNLQSVAGSTLGVISNVFQGLFNFIFTLTILFFMLLEREVLGVAILRLLPKKNQNYILHKTISVQKKMAEWFRGQFILMILVGLFVYIGILILGWTVGMEYAATIGILAGFAEILPYIGPLATYILVGLISINISWVTFVFGMGFVAVVQMLEGNILVPLVMKKAVGLPSIITLLALAAGGILGYSAGGIAMSIVGMVFSVPIAASIAIFIEEDASHYDS
jgi:predicted PurR-regulated permease PerM